jgi:Glycosyl transferase family 11
MKTIFFTHGGGRFGNQMFSYAQLLAFVFEQQDIDLVNIACWEYADLLENTYQNQVCTTSLDRRRYLGMRLLRWFCKKTFIKNGSVAKRFIIYLMYLYAGNPLAKYYQTQAITATISDAVLAQKISDFDLSQPVSQAGINQTNNTFLSGWNICNWQLVEKHQDQIRHYLRIHHRYTDISNSFISNLRPKYDFMIGVMIRHGDYKTWGDGCYYYDVQQYAHWMTSLGELFSDRGKIGFLIASDSPQKITDFGDQAVHFTTGIAGGQGHYLESLVQLSLCDLIITPPSTFSLWAAFLGNIPVLPLMKTDQVIEKEQLLQNHLFDFIDLNG